MKWWIVPLAVLSVVSGCSPPPAAYSPQADTRMSPNVLSRQLSQGMTEAQVVALREPDRVTLETCGGNTPKPWNCKVYIFGGLSGLRVLFENVGAAGWVVNAWF